MNSSSNTFNAVHPELRGGVRSRLANKLSPRQMAVLAAICDTILPHAHQCDDGDEDEGNPAKEMFPASERIVPEVAGMLCSWTTSFQFLLIHLALLLLSSRIGTLLLAGTPCLSCDAPFLHAFPDLPLHRREKIFLSWARSPFVLLQMFFKVLKCYTTFKYFSQADEAGRNPAWDAMGYTVPRTTMPEAAPRPRMASRLVNGDHGPDEVRLRLESLGCRMLGQGEAAGLVNAGQAVKGVVKADIGVDCDVAVVGSGSGGGVVAARLAAQGLRVIVVEKGRQFPVGTLSLLEGPSMAAMYEQSGALTSSDGGVIFLAGSTLGGGSAVNWAAALPTPEHIRRQWAALDLPRFDPGSGRYAADMAAVCRRLGVQDGCHEDSFQNAVLLCGCRKLGYPAARIPRNAAADHFCGFCGFGCPAPSRKRCAADTWLTDAVADAAVIVTACQADYVICAGRAHGSRRRRRRRVRGLVCSLLGGGRLVIAASAVVAAAGALHTPLLLRRSGLGNHNIGRHLSIHPVVTVWGHFPDGRGPQGKSYEGGIMTVYCPVSDGQFQSTAGYGCLLETPSVHPGTFSVLTPWLSSADFKRRMLRFARTANLIVLCRDRGQGSVVEDANGKLLIDYRLLSADKKNIAAGVEAALRVLAAAGAERIGTSCRDGEEFDCRCCSSSRELDAFIQRVRSKLFRGLSTPILSAHQLSTCRMGSDPATSGVDPNCESWDAEGLFVADSSVLPTASGVNPMVTIQSIAYGTADAVAAFCKQQHK